MSKSISVNAFFKTLMSIVNIVFPLITAPYIARILSIDGYTEYNKAVSMISWFSPFAVFGVYTFGMRTLSQIKNDKQAVSELFTKLFSFSVITSVIVTFVYVILILFVPSFQIYKKMYIVMATQLLFICFSTDWANEAYESYGFILVKTFFCRLLYVIAVFVFVRQEDDVFIYVILSSLSVIINNVLTFMYAKIKIGFSNINFKNLKELIKPLFVVFLLVNSGMLYTVFDKFVLTWFGNKTDITYYNVSQTIILAVINVTSSLILVSIPRLSFLWANNKEDEYYSVLNLTTKTFIAFHTPCCIGMACIAWEVIYYYSGMRYIQAGIVLLLFSIRHYISAFDMILAKQVLLATGNEKLLTRIYYIGGIYNIICKGVLVFIGKLTPELCVVTTATADIFVVLLQCYNIKKIGIKFSIFSKDIFKYLLVCLLFIPITFIIKHFIPSMDLVSVTKRTLLVISLCSIIYLSYLLIIKDALVFTIIRKLKRK